jgi:hypothetical protein
MTLSNAALDLVLSAIAAASAALPGDKVFARFAAAYAMGTATLETVQHTQGVLYARRNPENGDAVDSCMAALSAAKSALTGKEGPAVDFARCALRLASV